MELTEITAKPTPEEIVASIEAAYGNRIGAGLKSLIAKAIREAIKTERSELARIHLEDLQEAQRHAMKLVEALKPFSDWCDHAEAAFRVPMPDEDFPALYCVSGSPKMVSLRRAQSVLREKS